MLLLYTLIQAFQIQFRKQVTRSGELHSENCRVTFVSPNDIVTSRQKPYDTSPYKVSDVNLALTATSVFLISTDIICSMSLIFLWFFKEIYRNSVKLEKSGEKII